MARNIDKMASIDAQLRQLVPSKLSEDDKLVEYDVVLLDRFLDILQDLHGEDIRETVQECYELSAEYEGKHDPTKLEELGSRLTSLDPGDSIVVAKSFSNMLNLANLVGEVQIKKGDFADENSAATESDLEEALKRLVGELKKSPSEVFDSLKNQTVDLVLTAHPTQSVRRSLLQKHGRIRNCLAQLYAKDITPDDKQELDEALQREATPGLEYGRMNIGSHPSKRKPSDGIESLRAIPWIFAWTQTRFHVPVWLGFGAAFKHVIQKDIKNLHMLQEMYNEWPFFRVTIDLIEMVFAKGDPGIAALYYKLLVSEDLWPFGERLRGNYEETKSLLLKIAGHRDLLEGDPYLKQRLRLRDSYSTVLNVCQAYTLKRIRDPNYHCKLRPHISKEYVDYANKPADELVKLNPRSEYAPGLEDTLILTMKGIAAGMQNIG